MALPPKALFYFQEGAVCLNQHWFPVFLVYLEAVAGGVCNHNAVTVVNADCAGCPQDLLWCEVAYAVSLSNHVWIGLNFVYAEAGESGIAVEFGDEPALRC